MSDEKKTERHAPSRYVKGCQCSTCRDIDRLSIEELEAASETFDRLLAESRGTVATGMKR